MDALDEYSRIRVTLGFAAKRYGFEVVPAFASGVTITSLVDDVRNVRPGSLFVPSGHVDRRQLEAARDAGAYAALVPPEFYSEAADLGMPLLISAENPVALGKLASDINSDPSSCVATFAVAGYDDDEIHANVIRLADFLHMLGNPVGIISDAGSSSLQRELNLDYPLGIAEVQHTLSVCAEDGAAAVVIALTPATLRKNALQCVNIDVVGVEKGEDKVTEDALQRDEYDFDALSNSSAVSESKNSAGSSTKSNRNSMNTENSDIRAIDAYKIINAENDAARRKLSLSSGASFNTMNLSSNASRPSLSFYSLRQRYGFESRDHEYCVTRSNDSDELAALADQISGKDIKRHVSLSIAMVLAAGVRRGTIKSALRVSHELR